MFGPHTSHFAKDVRSILKDGLLNDMLCSLLTQDDMVESAAETRTRRSMSDSQLLTAEIVQQTSFDSDEGPGCSEHENEKSEDRNNHAAGIGQSQHFRDSDNEDSRHGSSESEENQPLNFGQSVHVSPSLAGHFLDAEDSVPEDPFPTKFEFHNIRKRKLCNSISKGLPIVPLNQDIENGRELDEIDNLKAKKNPWSNVTGDEKNGIRDEKLVASRMAVEEIHAEDYVECGDSWQHTNNQNTSNSFSSDKSKAPEGKRIDNLENKYRTRRAHSRDTSLPPEKLNNDSCDNDHDNGDNYDYGNDFFSMARKPTRGAHSTNNRTKNTYHNETQFPTKAANSPNNKTHSDNILETSRKHEGNYNVASRSEGSKSLNADCKESVMNVTLLSFGIQNKGSTTNLEPNLVNSGQKMFISNEAVSPEINRLLSQLTEYIMQQQEGDAMDQGGCSRPSDILASQNNKTGTTSPGEKELSSVNYHQSFQVFRMQESPPPATNTCGCSAQKDGNDHDPNSNHNSDQTSRSREKHPQQEGNDHRPKSDRRDSNQSDSREIGVIDYEDRAFTRGLSSRDEKRRSAGTKAIKKISCFKSDVTSYPLEVVEQVRIRNEMPSDRGNSSNLREEMKYAQQHRAPKRRVDIVVSRVNDSTQKLSDDDDDGHTRKRRDSKPDTTRRHGNDSISNVGTSRALHQSTDRNVEHSRERTSDRTKKRLPSTNGSPPKSQGTRRNNKPDVDYFHGASTSDSDVSSASVEKVTNSFGHRRRTTRNEVDEHHHEPCCDKRNYSQRKQTYYVTNRISPESSRSKEYGREETRREEKISRRKPSGSNERLASKRSHESVRNERRHSNRQDRVRLDPADHSKERRDRSVEKDLYRQSSNKSLNEPSVAQDTRRKSEIKNKPTRPAVSIITIATGVGSEDSVYDIRIPQNSHSRQESDKSRTHRNSTDSRKKESNRKKHSVDQNTSRRSSRANQGEDETEDAGVRKNSHRLQESDKFRTHRNSTDSRTNERTRTKHNADHNTSRTSRRANQDDDETGDVKIQKYSHRPQESDKFRTHRNSTDSRTNERTRTKHSLHQNTPRRSSRDNQEEDAGVRNDSHRPQEIDKSWTLRFINDSRTQESTRKNHRLDQNTPRRSSKANQEEDETKDVKEQKYSNRDQESDKSLTHRDSTDSRTQESYCKKHSVDQNTSRRSSRANQEDEAEDVGEQKYSNCGQESDKSRTHRNSTDSRANESNRKNHRHDQNTSRRSSKANREDDEAEDVGVRKHSHRSQENDKSRTRRFSTDSRSREINRKKHSVDQNKSRRSSRANQGDEAEDVAVQKYAHCDQESNKFRTHRYTLDSTFTGERTLRKHSSVDPKISKQSSVATQATLEREGSMVDARKTRNDPESDRRHVVSVGTQASPAPSPKPSLFCATRSLRRSQRTKKTRSRVHLPLTNKPSDPYRKVSKEALPTEKTVSIARQLLGTAYRIGKRPFKALKSKRRSVKPVKTNVRSNAGRGSSTDTEKTSDEDPDFEADALGSTAVENYRAVSVRSSFTTRTAYGGDEPINKDKPYSRSSGRHGKKRERELHERSSPLIVNHCNVNNTQFYSSDQPDKRRIMMCGTTEGVFDIRDTSLKPCYCGKANKKSPNRVDGFDLLCACEGDKCNCSTINCVSQQKCASKNYNERANGKERNSRAAFVPRNPCDKPAKEPPCAAVMARSGKYLEIDDSSDKKGKCPTSLQSRREPRGSNGGSGARGGNGTYDRITRSKNGKHRDDNDFPGLSSFDLAGRHLGDETPGAKRYNIPSTKLDDQSHSLRHGKCGGRYRENGGRHGENGECGSDGKGGKYGRDSGRGSTRDGNQDNSRSSNGTEHSRHGKDGGRDARSKNAYKDDDSKNKGRRDVRSKDGTDGVGGSDENDAKNARGMGGSGQSLNGKDTEKGEKKLGAELTSGPGKARKKYTGGSESSVSWAGEDDPKNDKEKPKSGSESQKSGSESDAGKPNNMSPRRRWAPRKSDKGTQATESANKGIQAKYPSSDEDSQEKLKRKNKSENSKSVAAVKGKKNDKKKEKEKERGKKRSHKMTREDAAARKRTRDQKVREKGHEGGIYHIVLKSSVDEPSAVLTRINADQ